MPKNPAASTPEAKTETDESGELARFGVGDFVTHTYLDPFVGAGGAEVTQVGVVVGVVDYRDDPAYAGPDGAPRPDGYRVAWLPTASDPLGADVLAPLATDSTPSL